MPLDTDYLDSESKAKLADQRWRIEHLYSVINKQGVAVPFKPNALQSRFLDEFHGRDVILKARQIGFTTLLTIIYLDDCIWTPGLGALVIAHRQEDAEKIFQTKVKWVWDRFREDWPRLVELLGLRTVGDSARELRFSNDSSMRVSLSGRSGTYQRLLVTEFGKMCAQFPKRAREVVTGAFNAVPLGGWRVIESTAEGQDGAFFKMARAAQAITPGRDWPEGEDFADEDPDIPKRAPRPLTNLDYAFHFFGWWENPEYRIPAHLAPPVPDYLDEYFDELERKLEITIDGDQRAWYAMTEIEQGGDMQREYPAHPAEAFSAALEGCYFEAQLFAARRRGRIGSFPVIPGMPVNTFWDLGRSDMTAIWLHQQDGEMNRFVGYYENSGEHISHFANWLRGWGEDNQTVFGQHHAPHDIDREDLFLPHGRLAEARNSGLRFKVVPRVSNKQEGIEASRGVFPRCRFDQAACALGLKRLAQYRKKWDDKAQMFLDEPVHDVSSHGADGFETFARGWKAKRKPKGVDRAELKYTGGW